MAWYIFPLELNSKFKKNIFAWTKETPTLTNPNSAKISTLQL